MFRTERLFSFTGSRALYRVVSSLHARIKEIFCCYCILQQLHIIPDNRRPNKVHGFLKPLSLTVSSTPEMCAGGSRRVFSISGAFCGQSYQINWRVNDCWAWNNCLSVLPSNLAVSCCHKCFGNGTPSSPRKKGELMSNKLTASGGPDCSSSGCFYNLNFCTIVAPYKEGTISPVQSCKTQHAWHQHL